MNRYRSRSITWLTALGTAMLAQTAVAQVAAPWAPIDPARLSETTKVLASDTYEGRAPGTVAGEKTVVYLIERFKALGLAPAGENGGWTQAVQLVHNVPGAPEKLFFSVGGKETRLVVGRDISPTTAREGDRISIADAPMVFVGYGVSAPERGWDDYKGVDLHGKIAVFLVNDPDFAAAPDEPVAGKFGGRAMTYYGRWTYKYEEAARRGAAGAVIIHDTDAAGYGWNVASNLVGGTYDIVRPKGSQEALPLRGWLSGEAATTLFNGAGLDLAALRKEARRSSFKPVQIGDARFTIDMPLLSERIQSRNVLAKLVGRKHPDEAIFFAAHWDAFGVGAPDAQGRTIRSGASDDALGVAGVIELARVFASRPRPDRTLMFAAWTAEERGLLGSETYALNPVQPIGKTVANLTLDVLQTAGPAHDVVLVGAGQNDLEDDLARAAARQGRTVTPDSQPQRGLFYRADHFTFAKQGVPTLLLMSLAGGPDLVAGGRAAGDAWVADYTGRCYHQPCDAWSADWDLRGAADDVALFYRMGLELANSRRWPRWRSASEFYLSGEKRRNAR